MTTRTIRVTRTWDAEVEALYGDTLDDLRAKVTEEYLDATPPDAEQRAVLEESDSQFDKWWERPDAELVAGALLDRFDRKTSEPGPAEAVFEKVRADRAAAAEETTE